MARGSSRGGLIFSVAAGFDTYNYSWDPKLAYTEFTKGTATYKNSYKTVVLDVKAYDGLSGENKYSSLKDNCLHALVAQAAIPVRSG